MAVVGSRIQGSDPFGCTPPLNCRFQRAGSNILGLIEGIGNRGQSSTPTNHLRAVSAVGSSRPERVDVQDRPASATSTPTRAQYDVPPVPPSARRNGILYNQDIRPMLDTGTLKPMNLPAVKTVKAKRILGLEEPLNKSIWSDGMQHLGNQPWPVHSVPLFAFYEGDRPRPGYKQEFRFKIKEDKHVNFCLRMRCGAGDRYNGGSVGLIHCPDRGEAFPGQEGQLVTITDVIVNPDSSIVVEAVGDLPFTVTRAWSPRGLRGMQCAIVDVDQAALVVDTILEACDSEVDLRRFSSLVRCVAPELADMLNDRHSIFTVFVPTVKALEQAFGNMSDEEIASRPDAKTIIACHIVTGKVACECLYNGRTLTAMEGSALRVRFGTWPRNDPQVNDVEIEHMDVKCENGIIHTVTGVLTPNGMSALNRRGPRGR